jgi:dihydrofolate reductase
MKISLIAAVGKNNVIGADGDLPWSLPKDMKFFSSTTRGHHVLMGRKNFESIPEKYRPLPGRPNLVVTRNTNYKADGAAVFTTINEAINHARLAGEEELFIVGGGEIYKQTLHLADALYITEVDAEPEGDAHFPAFERGAYKAEQIAQYDKDEKHNFSFKICVYSKKD